MNAPSCNKVMNHMASAVKKLTWIYLVEGVILPRFRSAYVGINGCKASIGGHPVQPDLRCLYPWLCVSYIYEGPGGTHGREGPGCHHVNLPGRLDCPLFADYSHHFLGSDNYCLTLFDLLIYLLKALVDLKIGHGFFFPVITP